MLFLLGDYYDQEALESEAIECLWNAALHGHPQTLIILVNIMRMVQQTKKQAAKLPQYFMKKQFTLIQNI